MIDDNNVIDYGNDITTNNKKQANVDVRTGNITGAGVIVGNNIYIDGDYIVQTSKEAISLGLKLLPPKYFQTYGIEGHFENGNVDLGLNFPI